MTEAGGCAQEGKRQWLTIVSEQRLAGEILKKEEDWAGVRGHVTEHRKGMTSWLTR